MEIIGEAYRELQNLVKLYAKENLPVLFIGETGTGKELFMKLYMQSSNRKRNQMTINCAALSDDLLRSEVFGHVSGAFTGAHSNRKGKIAACEDGILALDEIGDATPEFQAAILRVCESNSYSPLGSDKELDAKVLIIAATNKPENLRHDLRERFHILPIPPLQKEDIPALISHFLKKPLTEDMITELTSRQYPGNIRELKKACERLKVERGEKIFSKKINNILTHHFDYHRFRREMNTWQRYFQPLVDFYGKKHGFEKYKYQYMPWDGDPLEWFFRKVKFFNPNIEKDCTEDEEVAFLQSTNCFVFMSFLKRSINEENDLPLSVREDFISDTQTPEGCMGEFKEYLRYIFDCSILPCLLAYTYLTAEMPTDEPQTTIPQPHLSYLLNLPLKEAEKEFVKHYYDYNVKKHLNIKELEEVVGMSKKSLDQKFRRKE